MSAIYTNYAIQQLMLEMKDGSGTIPTSYYLGCFTTTPTVTTGAGGVEIDSAVNTWYARQSITLGSPSGRTQASTNIITFTNSAASAVTAGPVISVGVFDASTGGNLWIIVPTTTPITIGVTSQVIVPAGQLVFEMAAS